MRKSYEHDLYVDIFFFLSLSFILYSYSCLPDNFDCVVFFKKMFTSFYDAWRCIRLASKIQTNFRMLLTIIWVS